MQFVILLCNSVLGQINLTFCFTGETWKNSVWAGAVKMKMSSILINCSKPLVGTGSWYAMCFTSIRVCFPGTVMSTSN